jgi:hypothetical protein
MPILRRNTYSCLVASEGVLAVDFHPALLRLQLPADQAQDGGLAGSGTAHHCHHLAAREVHLRPVRIGRSP